MSDVVDFIEDTISWAGDITIASIQFVWNDFIRPQIEIVFAIFGITDEDVLFVEKTSSLVHSDITEDVVQAVNIKAVISMTKVGGSFYDWYTAYTGITRAQITAFYRFAKTGRYIHGLPDMEIKGGEVDYDSIDAALNTVKGAACTRLTASTFHPSNEVYFKDKFQASPYFYIPWENKLTHDDPYGQSKSDYRFDSVTFNSGTGNYEIDIHRTAEEALFWIEGPVHIVEGDSATYTLKSNRTVPVGESITIDLAYTGTAPGTDYTEVASAVITAGNTEVDFVVTTNENTASDGSRTIIVTIDAIDNTGGVFEAVSIHTLDHVTTTITDDEGIILTMPSVVAVESSGTAIVPVKLENATTWPNFDVDYAFTNGTALGGIDFDATPGTLTFAGTTGEIQNMSIPITTGDGDDDNETFEVYFTACDDSSVDISQVCTVTISDGSDTGPAPGTVVLYDTIIEANYTPEQSLIVTYHLTVDPSTEWFYWVYKLSEGTFPGIDPSTSFISNLEMLPVAIIKTDGVDVNSDTETEAYKTTKRLLETLALDIDVITDNVSQNDDYALVEDLYLNFALCPNSTEEIVSKALWLTFYNIIVTNGITSSTNSYTAAFTEQAVNNAMVWAIHSHTPDKVGTITNGGEFYHEIELIAEQSHYDSATDTTIIDVEESSNLWIRHQTASGVYSEIRVYGLNGMSAIDKSGTWDMASNKLGDDNFTIPVSHFVLTSLRPREQLVLYQYMLRIDAYAALIDHIEFYETNAFAVLFEFVSIVITIYTIGQASGPLEVIRQILIHYLVSELVVYLAEVTGNAEFAAIVGLVALIALGGQENSMLDFASAEGVINASTQFANNLTLAYNTETQGLLEDLQELNEQAEAQMQEIEDAAPSEGAVTSEFLVALNSVDTTVFPAIKAQYDFDLLYNYDRLIADYYDINLRTGVT